MKKFFQKEVDNVSTVAINFGIENKSKKKVATIERKIIVSSDYT